MEETYNLTAIILNRRSHAEGDGRVAAYSRERGKLDLAVRGMKKIKSKLAGHLEPLTLVNIMAVRGRQYDYVGAAMSENCYAGLKRDLEKLNAAGQAVNVFNKLVKTGEADEKLFILLKDFLQALDSRELRVASCELLLNLFIFKLLIELGHQPELNFCVNCRVEIMPAGMKFDFERGGLVCGRCASRAGLIISENCVKLLRLAEKNDLGKLMKIKIDKKTEKEAEHIISSFLSYSF
ncbi:MAG: DNA repair protein RecO [bacterium]|nr:DNA repair protein RecO [bacterium]